MFRLADIRCKIEGSALSAVGAAGATLGAAAFAGWLHLFSCAFFAGAASYLYQPGATGAIDEQGPIFFRHLSRRVGWLVAVIAFPVWLAWGEERYVGWIVRGCGLFGVLCGSLPGVQHQVDAAKQRQAVNAKDAS